MRLNTSLSTIFGATLLATLSACGGSSADADPFALIQQGDYAAAVAVIKPKLKTVEQGTDAHKELLLAYTEALSVNSPEEAKDEFIAAIDSDRDFLEPKDVTYIVNRMANQNHLMAAIDVMNKGQKTWPDDKDIDVILQELITASQSSGNDAALEKLKSMGYLGD